MTSLELFVISLL